MQRVKVEVEATRSALATAMLNSKTTPQAASGCGTALKFLCPGLFITSPDHLVHKCWNFITFIPEIVSSCSPQTIAVDDTVEGGSVRKTKRQIVVHHTDIIGDVFWNEHPEILDS